MHWAAFYALHTRRHTDVGLQKISEARALESSLHGAARRLVALSPTPAAWRERRWRGHHRGRRRRCGVSLGANAALGSKTVVM